MKSEINILFPVLVQRAKENGKVPPDPDSANLIIVDCLVSRVTCYTGGAEISIEYEEEYNPASTFAEFEDRARNYAMTVIRGIDFPGIAPGV